MGWTKVCETARWRIWVLKGNARARMLLENLDHLRVRWISRGSYETAWVTPADCVHTSMDVEQLSDRKLTTPSGMVFLFVGQGRTFLVTLVCKRECANGCEPEPARWSRITHSLAQR